MTTNHRERLDPALIRPGRCDLQIELQNASFSMVTRLFLKFFPNNVNEANKFAKLIPEVKVSMAKLQGHFLKYRHDVNLVLDKYTEVLSEEQSVADMTVVEWLDRQNLTKYVPQFVKQTCFFVNEIKYQLNEEGKFSDKFKFEDSIDKSRINRMVNCEAQAMQDFQYLSRHSALSILAQDIQDFETGKKLVELLPSADDKHLTSITGFQLKDIVSESYSVDDLIEGIK